MVKHEHLIVRAECEEVLVDVELTKLWLIELVSILKMKIVNGPHVSYVDVPGNSGISGVVIIETSHISVHCWDKEVPKLLQLDVYSCSSVIIEDVFKHLEVFKPQKVEYKFLDREKGLIENH